jgi:AcrR family transcriptional regulator
MDFAGREGIQKLTMRALGQILDVDATAIYRHFPISI